MTCLAICCQSSNEVSRKTAIQHGCLWALRERGARPPQDGRERAINWRRASRSPKPPPGWRLAVPFAAYCRLTIR